MGYISEVFDRVDIGKVSRFFLVGEAPVKSAGGDYEKRLDSAYDGIMDFLKEKYKDEKEILEAESRINAFASVHENVYMEIGMKCGAQLTSQLFEKE